MAKNGITFSTTGDMGKGEISLGPRSSVDNVNNKIY